MSLGAERRPRTASRSRRPPQPSPCRVLRLLRRTPWFGGRVTQRTSRGFIFRRTSLTYSSGSAGRPSVGLSRLKYAQAHQWYVSGAWISTTPGALGRCQPAGLPWPVLARRAGGCRVPPAVRCSRRKAAEHPRRDERRRIRRCTASAAPPPPSGSLRSALWDEVDIEPVKNLIAQRGGRGVSRQRTRRSGSCSRNRASTGAWMAIATSDFCGPQFTGMWRDVAWHNELTELVRSRP